VIEDMLDVTRIENKKFEIIKGLFNFRDTVKEVCEIMDFQLKQKGLGLEVSIRDRVPRVICSDIKRIKQILFNLIGNAMKFTFQG
jgi:signal transduction histidine kinase